MVKTACSNVETARRGPKNVEIELKLPINSRIAVIIRCVIGIGIFEITKSD